eukprot:SAG31_NODE_2079_length_6498_cov_3.416159_6_plen_93_part_00
MACLHVSSCETLIQNALQGLSPHVVLKCLKVAISLLDGTVAEEDDDDQPPGGKSCMSFPSIWSTASTASCVLPEAVSALIHDRVHAPLPNGK